jgi:hypothetical protein
MSTRKTAIIKDPNVAKYPFMIYHRVYNTTGATSGAGTAYPSEAPEFTVGFNGGRVARSIIVFVDRCLPFYLSLLAIVFYMFDLRKLITPLVSPNSSYSVKSFIIYEEVWKVLNRIIFTIIYTLFVTV